MARIAVPDGNPAAPLHADAPWVAHADACLSLRFGHVHCSACAQACPVGCLSVQDSAIVLAEGCLGCGRCAAVCPTEAIELSGFRKPLHHDAQEVVRYVDCWKVPRTDSPAGAVRVPCLGGVSVNRILEAIEHKPKSALIFLDRGWCSDCRAGDKTASEVFPALEEASALLRACGAGEEALPRMEKRPLPPTQCPDDIPDAAAETVLSRRVFFRNLAQGVALSARQVITPQGVPEPVVVNKNLGRSGPVTPAARLRRLELTTRLAARHEKQAGAAWFPRVEIGADCRDHRVCVSVCPTGALASYENGEGRGVTFDTRRCITCDACARHCPSGALRYHAAGGALAEVVALTRHAERECEDCGRSFSVTDGERYCTSCRKTRDSFSMFFGSGSGRSVAAPDTAAGNRP